MRFRPLKHLSKIIFVIGLVSACRSDPKASDDSFLSSLNGGAYESQSGIGFIPIGERTQARTLRGRVQCNPGIDQVPIHHAQVDLLVNGKVIETAYTDRDGYYSLAFNFLKGNAYELKIFTSKWSQTLKVATGARGPAGGREADHFVDCQAKN